MHPSPLATLLFLGFISGTSAQAECFSAQDLSRYIQYCEDNKEAVTSANNCLNKSLEEWNQSASKLAFVKSKSDLAQKERLDVSSEKYKDTLKELTSLVSRMQKRASDIEFYPLVMVDDRAIEEGAESLSCYKNNVDRAQEILGKLDDKILEGLSLIEEYAYLESAVEKRIALIKQSKGASAPILGDKNIQDTSQPNLKNKKRGFSDISGTETIQGGQK